MRCGRQVSRRQRRDPLRRRQPATPRQGHLPDVRAGRATRARHTRRLPRVSSVTGTPAAARRRRSTSTSSGRIGSTQVGANGLRARTIRVAVGRFHGPWRSTIMSMRRPPPRGSGRTDRNRGDFGVAQILPGAALGERVEGPELHPSDALGQELLRGSAGVVHEGLRVLVVRRPLGRGHRWQSSSGGAGPV